MLVLLEAANHHNHRIPSPEKRILGPRRVTFCSSWHFWPSESDGIGFGVGRRTDMAHSGFGIKDDSLQGNSRRIKPQPQIVLKNINIDRCKCS